MNSINVIPSAKRLVTYLSGRNYWSVPKNKGSSASHPDNLNSRGIARTHIKRTTKRNNKKRACRFSFLLSLSLYLAIYRFLSVILV